MNETSENWGWKNVYTLFKFENGVPIKAAQSVSTILLRILLCRREDMISTVGL